MIIADTSVIYALVDAADNWHERVRVWYESAEPAFATTPLVLAEADHLIAARAGAAARDAWRRDLTAGAYEVHWWDSATADAVARAIAHADLGIDLTDTSLAALADRLQITEIATLDQRHFRALRTPRGGAYRLLPMDA